ncbi:hypothetical protein [Cohnella sp.]|uniref:hypothetical protein n=1 Tax=Cohnella sp. TaxID=1883426 RepID=UPI00370441EF
MSTKPILPRNVADALTDLRRGYETSDIMRILYGGNYVAEHYRESAEVVRFFVNVIPDVIVSAIANGYEVEKSAEELAEEARQATHGRIRIRYETCRRIERLGWLDSATEQSAFAAGMKYVLNELGEKIPGVNAPEGVSA